MGNDMIYFAHMWRLGRKERIGPDGRIQYAGGMMKTRADLADIWYPDLDAVQRRLEQIGRAIEGTGFGLICASHGPASVTSSAMGLADYWINAIEDPGLIDQFHQRIEDYALRELELYIRCGADAISFGVNAAMKSGPICSPEMRRRFLYPFLRQRVRIAHENDLPLVLHVDGDVTSLLDEFIDIGADLLNPLEPCEGQQDIYQVKRRWGDRIALQGNIDVGGVLFDGTPEQVRQDTLEHLEKLSVGGGYVCASSHNLHRDVPLANFHAMRDTVHEFRTDVE